jgi:hypothetical protein
MQGRTVHFLITPPQIYNPKISPSLVLTLDETDGWNNLWSCQGTSEDKGGVVPKLGNQGVRGVSIVTLP